MSLTVMALDPSSTATGYAVLTANRLLDAGKLTGKRSGSAIARVLEMRRELLALLNEHLPTTILVEVPVGKQYTRTPGKKSGLPVWGMAAGAVWMVCEDWAEGRTAADSLVAGFTWKDGDRRIVVPISNTLWTRGSTKTGRRSMVESRFKSYDALRDSGGDVSDAISLALWYDARRLIPVERQPHD